MLMIIVFDFIAYSTKLVKQVVWKLVKTWPVSYVRLDEFRDTIRKF